MAIPDFFYIALFYEVPNHPKGNATPSALKTEFVFIKS